MLGLLVRLQCEIEPLRRRSLERIGAQDRGVYAFAGLLAFLVASESMAPPVIVTAGGAEISLIGLCVFFGSLLIALVVTFPVGLLFF
jgi:hypothetical protein